MMKKKQRSEERTRVHHVDIMDDLILEILLRVPPISVLRFKRVCKKWYSLISNPDFLRSHSSLQFEKRTDLLIHAHDIRACLFYKHFEFLFLPQEKLQLPLLKIFHRHPLSLFPENHQHCNLSDSCNGLLLLCFSEIINFSAVNNTYYIFNLITKHYLKLPNTNPIPNVREDDCDANTYIVFDPSVSLSYKVIRWLKNEFESPSNVHCQLYSSETGSWKLLSISFPIDEYFYFDSRPTLLNGVLYWSYFTTPSDVSYCFDVEKESVSFLPLPPKPNGFDYRQCLYFGVCGGRLRLIEKYLETLEYDNPYTLPCSFDIMEMQQEQLQRQDDCSPWIVKYHVNIEMVFNRPFLREHPREVDFNNEEEEEEMVFNRSFLREYPGDFEFIHCYKIKNKGGEEEEVLFLNINHTSIISYNLASDTFGKELTVPHGKTSSSLNFRRFYPFTPTLFPIS